MRALRVPPGLALLCAAMGALLVTAAALAAPQAIGIAAAVVNDVRIKPGGAAPFQPARLRQRVALADQVQTGADSRLQLLLLDRTQFTIGSNARLTIDRFVYDPDAGVLSASVAKGAFRFMSGRSSARKGTTITSPAATIGIRGTILDGVVGERAIAIARNERSIPRDTQGDPESATLVVLRGPGARTAGGFRVGAADVTGVRETVTLDRPLLAAYVPRAGAEPIGPFALSLPGVAWLNGLILIPPERLPAAGAAPLPLPDNDRRRTGPRPGLPGEWDDAREPGFSIPALPDFPTGAGSPPPQRGQPAMPPGATTPQRPPSPPSSGPTGTPNQSSP